MVRCGLEAHVRYKKIGRKTLTFYIRCGSGRINNQVGPWPLFKRREVLLRPCLIVVIILVGLFSVPKTGATGDTTPWTRFQDEKSDLFGYKDETGRIRIPAKFVMADAQFFYDIIAVIEKTGKEYFQAYYLLKSGGKKGLNSLYMSGNYLDCECEGKIRFRNSTTDLVGFFDRDGNIAIPAMYSDAEPFANNMAMVLKDAQRVCLDGKPYPSDKGGCEHWRWEGGRSHLIDVKNHILIQDFKHTRHLDWFSIKITSEKPDNPLRDSFKGTNGKYYSFINFKKEFIHWLESDFFLSTDDGTLKHCLFDIIAFEKRGTPQNSLCKNKFLKDTANQVLDLTTRLKAKDISYEVHDNPVGIMLIPQNNETFYKTYFDSCQRPETRLYPAFDLVVSHCDKNLKKDLLQQDVFTFVKTEQGYRLTAFSPANL